LPTAFPESLIRQLLGRRTFIQLQVPFSCPTTLTPSLPISSFTYRVAYHLASMKHKSPPGVTH